MSFLFFSFHPHRQMERGQIVLKSAFLWGGFIRWLYELAADCVEADFRQEG